MLFAGCFGDADDPATSPIDPEPLEDVLYQVAEVLAFEATAEDGTALRGHVYLPNGTGPFATVLELSPYWNTRDHSEELVIETEDGRRTLGLWLGPFIDAGFAVALVNMRGTGESDGCIQWGGMTDVSDAVAVVETLADAEWSDRAVGMYGASYEGWSQFMAVAGGAPSLKAVVPISPVVDLYSVTVWNGAPNTAHGYMWPLWTAGAGAGGFGAFRTNLQGANTAPVVPDTSPEHLACPRYGEDLEAIGKTAQDGDRSPYYASRDLRPLLADAPSVPTLLVNGLKEREGSIYQVDGLWEALDSRNTRFLLGQWDHAWPLTSEDDFAVFNTEFAVPWFDRYLRGGPEVVEPGIVTYQDDGGGWNQGDEWPPAGEPVPLYLSDRDLIQNRSQVVSSEQSYQSNDEDLDPSDCPGVKAIYVSPSLAEDVTIAGRWNLDFTLSSTFPDGHVTAAVWRDTLPWPCGEDPGTDEDYEVAHAYTDLAHRGHLPQGRPFPVDQKEVMQMTSEPHASSIRAGERLILTIGSGDDLLIPDAKKPVLTVHTGVDRSGVLVLNVVDGELRFQDESAADPAMPRGWTT